MNINPKSVMMTPDLNLMDDSLLTVILKIPVEVWVSSGEPFLPLDSKLRDKMNVLLLW